MRAHATTFEKIFEILTKNESEVTALAVRYEIITRTHLINMHREISKRINHEIRNDTSRTEKPLVDYISYLLRESTTNDKKRYDARSANNN